MNKNLSVIGFFVTAVLLASSALIFNSCNSGDTNPTPTGTTPTIISFTPDAATEGAVVIITGTNFSSTASENVVTFNGTQATVTGATVTQITTTVPTGATTGKIAITVNSKTATSSTDFTVESNNTNVPSITSFSPTSGQTGTTVIITGTNFSATASENIVTFNGTNATITQATTTQITTTVPTGATTGKIVITVNSKTVTSSTDFTVESNNANVPSITSFSPASGSTGTTVIINGTNFSVTPSENVIAFNGTQGTVTEATTTQITTTVPVGASTGKITIHVGNLTATSNDDFVYLPSAIVSTLAGDGSDSDFENPMGVASDGSGNIYVADAAKNLIRKITPDGVISTLAGSGSADYADGTGTAASFNGPFGVAVDAVGNVFVADTYNHRIRKITVDGIVSTLAGNGDSDFADGTGTEARFSYPTGVAVDASGNVYVAEIGNYRIRKITAEGVVSTLAGSGASGSDDGIGTDAQFNAPLALTVDASGIVYVADKHRIRKVSADGIVSTVAGSSSGFSDGAGSAAQFNTPSGIVVDSSGNIYISDTDNNRIRMMTSGGVVSTLAGGTIGYAEGTGTEAQFSSPFGITIDVTSNIYVGDTNNKRIRKIVIE
ncbi:MAG TPA: IPT/TIG domain-containing protein [Cyclobacteriaceae bacterium]|nr:IPT/TIG domain-containing protein [Cyclobacteriaceae bacterium]